jgi:YesN/AraC family two-component response regulator
MLHYRNRAIEEMAGRIRERLEKTRSSSYVERCRTYIRKHYREKIYLGDIADALEISPSYLSRVFKKETGQNIQDYVNSLRVERAVNLLVYTDKSLSEIAEYVNFPNQSYFGKIFRQYKQMTPKEYRNRFTPSDKL